LLAYKNFGETSLREIKEMLTAKNLRLGQALEGTEDFIPAAEPPPPSNEGVLATPIERVEFSIRARRALENLNVNLLGELASKSEAELLACKNFGQTSLNEIRQRLAEYGLHLREASGEAPRK
jgi:DNA-directed RNA polymerase subunit alpha